MKNTLRLSDTPLGACLPFSPYPAKIRLFGGRGGPRPPFTPKIAIFGVGHSGHPNMTHMHHSLVE